VGVSKTANALLPVLSPKAVRLSCCGLAPEKTRLAASYRHAWSWAD
jgi:hypothetical protein